MLDTWQPTGDDAREVRRILLQGLTYRRPRWAVDPMMRQINRRALARSLQTARDLRRAEKAVQ